MYRTLILTTALTLTQIICAYSQRKTYHDYTYYKDHPYPSYQSVLNTFFNTYSVRDLPENFMYEFAKMPDGIFVYEKNPHVEPAIYQNHRLFWDKDGYRKLDLPGKRQDGLESSRALYDSRERFFNENLFFGYPGWEEDVIKVLENEDILDDYYLYSLGYAYSMHALNNISPFSDYKGNEFDKRFDIRDLPEEKIRNAIHCFQLSYKTFSELQNQNPDYDTFVGKIAIKTSCEAMVPYLEFMILGLDSIANLFLKNAKFDEFYVSTAKNYLSCCPENAILITGSDMDTYPLLYVQEKLNFRRDVTVVNASLAYMPRYINYLSKFQTNGRNLSCDIPFGKYNRSRLYYFYLGKETEDPVGYSSILEELNSGNFDLVDTIETSAGYYIFQLPVRSFSIPVSSSDQVENLEKKYVFSFDDYIMLYDIYFLNLISRHHPDRPLTFVNTLSEKELEPYKHYLYQQGLVYVLFPRYSSDAKECNGEKSSELINNFSWEGINKESSEDEQKKNFLLNYLITAGKTAGALAESSPEKAGELADLIFEKIPGTIYPYSFEVIDLAKTYYLAGEPEKGDKVFNMVILNSKTYIDAALKKKERKEELIRTYDFRLYAYTIEETTEILKKHDRRKLTSKAGRVLKKFNKTLEDVQSK